MTRPIFSWPGDPKNQITVELAASDVLASKLRPHERQRADIEWLGIIHGANGQIGALGRLKWNGVLVEVVSGATMTLRPHIAAALRKALHDELRALMDHHEP